MTGAQSDSSESLPCPSLLHSGRWELCHTSFSTRASGRDPVSWMGQREKTWPWGKQQGWERKTPEFIAAHRGTEIAMHSSLERGHTAWGSIGKPTPGAATQTASGFLPSVLLLPAAAHWFTSITPSIWHNPFPLYRPRGHQRDLSF